MSDLGVAEIPLVENERVPLPPVTPPARNSLVDGPILRTLLRLAWPNVVALSAGVCVVVAETSYIGRLGVESLAAMALVFPFVILTMTMSGGAMGGGVTSAIARALGAGDTERASMLASHAVLIGLTFGLAFMLVMLIFGPALLQLLGGRGNVLAQAIGYIQIFFGGVVCPWLMSTLAGILRGTGNMKLPSLMVLGSAVCQIILGGTLGLGLGPVPQFGMRGVAAGSLIAFTISTAIMAWYILSGRARINFIIKGLRIQRGMFFDILKVGAVACFSPLQSVLTVTIFTRMLADFGTEVLAGYGIGARLEFMLTSIAFAVGIASVPMVGMAIGADRLDRGLRVVRVGRPDRHCDCDLPGPLGQHLHQRSRRARRQPAISAYGGADVRLHRAVDLDVLFLAGCGQSARPRAGADRAAAVRRGRRLVAAEPPSDACELLCAGGGIDGGAGRALRLERDPDAMGTETRACPADSSGAVMN
jgi:Na+-driven multidrug efflux pump